MNSRIVLWIEGALFMGLLLLANIGLLRGVPMVDWVFVPSAVGAGEWHRLFLHPWVHVSGYHLLLDASAFFALFFMLDRVRAFERWRILAMAWAGALFAVWQAEPMVELLGLCGLSGLAHGLFAAVCVQWLRRADLRKPGAWLLAGLCLKVTVELFIDQSLFAFVHVGSVGHPLVWCHAGGALGGGVAACRGKRI